MILQCLFFLVFPNLEKRLALLGLKDNIKDGDKLWTLVSPDFIYGGFIVHNSGGNSEEFPVVLIKCVSLGLFDITMLSLSEYSELGEDIGFM